MFTNLQELSDAALVLVRNEHEGAGEIKPVEALSVASSVVTDISRRLDGTTRTQAYSGDGIAYQFALPTWWAPGLSFIERVEYPASQQYRAIVDPSEVEIWPDPGAPTHLHFNTFTPAVGTDNILLVARGHYFADNVSSPATNIPADLQRGFEYAVAAEYALLFATYYGHTTHGGQDTEVDGQGQSSTWRSIHEMLLEQAGNRLNLDLSEGPPGSAGGGGSTGSYPPALAWADVDPTARGRGLIGRSARER